MYGDGSAIEVCLISLGMGVGVFVSFVFCFYLLCAYVLVIFSWITTSFLTFTVIQNTIFQVKAKKGEEVLVL